MVRLCEVFYAAKAKLAGDSKDRGHCVVELNLDRRVKALRMVDTGVNTISEGYRRRKERCEADQRSDIEHIEDAHMKRCSTVLAIRQRNT